LGVPVEKSAGTFFLFLQIFFEKTREMKKTRKTKKIKMHGTRWHYFSETGLKIGAAFF